tara:strand:- start:107 stop:820 length:714 start_codon:yes stop_codon:yes gene_type:complete
MYINILHFIISFFDHSNKKKIINFFRDKFKNNIAVLIDVGAHHGETINLFNKEFNVKSIVSFEPSEKNYNQLLRKSKNLKNVKTFNFALGEKNQSTDFNEHFESQSSTISKINQKSKYYKKKNFFLNPFKNKNKKINITKIKMNRLEGILKELKIKEVDILKIDTEGYDYKVIKGLGESIKFVKYIYFEHHFHDMLIKKYNLSDVNSYLYNYNFIKVFKSKMKFRKTFEYIYFNRSY